MPRYPANRLESISLSREDLVDRALQAEPALNRRYDDTAELAALRRRLFAVERWANRIVASPPSRLMTAALLSPQKLSGVIEDLAAAAARAAPPRAGNMTADQLKSRAAARRRSPPTARGSEAESLADALIVMLTNLGEYVGGTWQLLPCYPMDESDGDDDVPMELVHSPPADEVVAVVETFEPGRLQRGRARAEEWASFAGAKLDALARSAATDLEAKLRGGVAGLAIDDVSLALANAGERSQAAHANLLAAVQDMRRALEPDAEARGSWWGNAGRSIAQQVDEWLETVPPALQVDRHKRQQLKRDMEAAFGYIVQYALLMQGNAASYELVCMVDHLAAICRGLRETLDRIIPVTEVRAATATEELAAQVECTRAIVSEEQLNRWRAELGDDAVRAGNIVREAIGVHGQKKGLQLNELARLATAPQPRGGGRSPGSDSVENLLTGMQRVGLAIRLPARVFRVNNDKAARVGAGRRTHAGRAWWFNPLGAALAMPLE